MIITKTTIAKRILIPSVIERNSFFVVLIFKLGLLIFLYKPKNIILTIVKIEI
jgi:hypothetical protein